MNEDAKEAMLMLLFVWGGAIIAGAVGGTIAGIIIRESMLCVSRITS